MTALSGHSDTHRAPARRQDGQKPSTLGTLTALWQLIEAGRSRLRALDQLDRLDDRTLKDIGVHRTELSSILHHDLRDPSRRQR